MKQELYRQCFELLEKYVGIRKDLSFGCEIHKLNYWKNSSNPNFREPHIGIITRNPSSFDTWYQVWVNWEDSGTYSTTEFCTYILNEKDDNWEKRWKIIGHPPILSDVFTAISNTKGRDCYWEIEYDKDWCYVELGYFEKIAQRWNLNEPLLKNQSDELGEYLISLL